MKERTGRLKREWNELNSYHFYGPVVFETAATSSILTESEYNFLSHGYRQSVNTHPARVKCSHCGQWGEIKTACEFCGAPIDPI